MNTRDYLHLYLGCDCYYDKTHYAGKLIGVEDDSAFTWDTVNGRVVWNAQKLIPMLRPLGDMTDDELVEFEGIAHSDYSSLVDLSVHENRKVSLPSHFDAVSFLLSKHFDLFGIIEAGQAIDKTKLPAPNTP